MIILDVLFVDMQYDETLSDLFWDCPIVSNFILDMEQASLGRQFTFSKRDFFFGYNLKLDHPYKFLIFHMKYYIYGKRCKSEDLVVNEFLYKLKFAMKVENHLSYSKKETYIPYEKIYEAFICGRISL